MAGDHPQQERLPCAFAVLMNGKRKNENELDENEPNKKEKGPPKSVALIEEPHGDVVYWDKWIKKEEATLIFEDLKKTVPWQQEEVVMFGKRLNAARKSCYYGDKGVSYYYAGKKRSSLGMWHPALLPLKKRLEETTGQTYNFALLNYYHSGKDYMGFHSDDEKDLFPRSRIASISFGAKRKFVFKPKKTLSHSSGKPSHSFEKKTPTGKTSHSSGNEPTPSHSSEPSHIHKNLPSHSSENVSSQELGNVTVELSHGSLLVMNGITQERWSHSLPKALHVTTPRINITFRLMR